VLDVAVVAGIHFIDLPSQNASLFGKRLEERPRRVSFCDTAYERSRKTAPAILGEPKRFFKTAQTEITQPLSHKIPGLSWLESPKIELTLSAG
jgi:hypothetical protein